MKIYSLLPSLPLLRLLSFFFACSSLPVSAAEKDVGGGIDLAARVLPEDAKALEKSETLVKEALAHSAQRNTEDKSSLKVVAEMKSLLALKRLPIKKTEDLHGNWKVRSLQVRGVGAYSYPFFKCRIFPEEKALVFHKATGSQRRFGLLERDSPERFLFAGAMYYSYDPAPRSYKGSGEEASKEDLDRNDVAWLYKIGAKRLLMVFPSSGESLEIYELKR